MNCVRIGVVCVLAAVVPVIAVAQTSKPPAQTTRPKPPAKPTGPGWEVSFRAGLASGAGAPEGLSETPPAGPTFTMADGATPTRAVTSWFFGDGTSLLNQVLQLRGVTTRMDALNTGSWPVVSRRMGPQFGATIGRRVKGGVWLEFGVDYSMDPLGFDDDAKAKIENTRAGFETALRALASSAPAVITASEVTSTATLEPDGERLFVSAVVQYRGGGPVMRPYLLAGVGAVSSFGSPATLTLQSRYRLTNPTPTVIEEADTLRLDTESSGSGVWILGGGMMRDLNRGSAFRAEVRLLATTTKLVTKLESRPTRATTIPGGAIILNGTTPGLQFSSSPAIQPTLSGADIFNFEAFTGDGGALQWVVSGAYVRKF